MTQATSCEGTRVLDSFPVPESHVTFYDTAGFFHLGEIEEGQCFVNHFFMQRQAPEKGEGKEESMNDTGDRGIKAR